MHHVPATQLAGLRPSYTCSRSVTSIEAEEAVASSLVDIVIVNWIILHATL